MSQAAREFHLEWDFHGQNPGEALLHAFRALHARLQKGEHRG
jgi:hypothetical protein